MWSRWNVIGMRRRWGSLENAPGRGAWSKPSMNGSDRTDGRSTAAEWIKLAFLAREILIDCPKAGCAGKILTGQRRFGETAGTGSRIVLRCTREPEEHEIAVTIEPYTAEEKEALEASHGSEKRVQCKRCETPMKLGSVEVSDAWTDSVSTESAYFCPWCGVKWMVPSDVKCCHAS